MKEFLTPEIFSQAKELAWLASILFPAIGMAFSQRQRQNIIERDGNKCQFPERHRCNGNQQLQVHHVIPQRYAKDVLHIDPDYEDNGITLCEYSHQNLVHPDMSKARKEYGKNKNSYKDTFEARQEQLRNRQIYWNDKWDRLFNSIVQKNKQRQARK